MAEGKKINDIGVLDVSAVVDETLYPVYDPNRPTSAARSSAQQIADYVKSKVNADAAHASEQEDTDQERLASVGKVQEMMDGVLRKVKSIYDTLANYAFVNGKPEIDFGDLPSTRIVTISAVHATVTCSPYAVDGGQFNATIAPDNDYFVTEGSVLVKMGGVDITSQALSGNTITIASVSGDIEISATAETYITDGLVFHLDGQNQGDTPGHWIDRVGGVDFELTNATDTQNGVDFTLEPFVQGLASENIDIIASQGTIEGCITAHSTFANAIRSILIQGTSSKSLMTLQYSATSNGFLLANGTTNTGGIDGYVFPDGIPSSGHVLISANNDRAVINGNQVTGRINTHTVDLTTNECRLGFNASSSIQRTADAKIHSLRIYNRKLTINEMMQNQRIDNAKYFGI